MNDFHSKLAAALALAAGCALPASAQNFPSKPVRIVVPYAAGGPVDTVARIVGQNLTAKWGQQVVVDNRAGSGGALGAHSVVKSPPDGYTLLVTNAGPITSYPHLRKSVLFDFEKDLTPITLMSKSSIVLVVHPSLPAKTVPELVRLAKRQPGAMTYATSGVGGVQHLAMVLLESMAGIRLVHIPYKGASQSSVDLLSGQVPMQFNSVLGTIQHIQQGKLRPLGVSTREPNAALPDVPTIASYYPGFEITSWTGVYGPAGMPKALVDQLYRDVTAAVSVPESKQRLNELGLDLVHGTPADMADFARNESRLFAKLMSAAGIEKE
ncbi:MAG TPA: tripartite tricarboxylate transporter substrate binding protein [Burkholderiales bacterium]|nr:tripartite tricarboxylate transporter substrate binding protein [Burkholderiales bacterium]